MMNTFTIPSDKFKMMGDWRDQALRLQKKYPKLTDDDLRYESGYVSDLLKRIEARLKMSRTEVVELIRKVQALQVATKLPVQ